MVVLRLTNAARKDGAAQLAKDYTEEQLTDIVPARVVNMHRVRSIPLLGVLLAAALGTITLGLLVIGGARIHRRNFAVLRALGLDARRLRGVLGWQAVLTAALMVAIGLPLGVIGGVTLWHHVAADTGVALTAVVPPALLVLVPATLVVAIACSLVAGHRVRRTQVAQLLREE
jgi:predicted lysophospholipase L1 biosynthesis ABC-type transport system permease subunit